MFERFTDQARRAVVLAQNEAKRLHHVQTGTEDLLVALLLEKDGVPVRALAKFDVSVSKARQNVERLGVPIATPPIAGIPPFTENAKKSLELALREALQLGDNYIGTGHLLLGIIRHNADVVKAVFGGIDGDTLRPAITSEIGRRSGIVRPAQPTEQPVRSSAEIADDITDLLLRLSKLRAEHAEATRRESGAKSRH